MKLVFLGAPGAGKGTQAKTLCEKEGWPHLSSGDILRAEISGGTELGKQAKTYMDAGQLVPDDLVVAMMVERIGRDDCAEGFVLDGFPRTVVQAKALDEALAKLGRPMDAAIYFHVGDEEVVERITGRRLCPDCGAIYHVRTLRPGVEGECDKCGARLTQRKDDTEEVVRERLRAYHGQTEPLIDYYRQQGLLQRIDAEQSIDAIQEALVAALGEVGRAN